MKAAVLAGGILILAAPPVAAPPRPSRIAVAIVVDQLSAWVAEERLPRLPKTGGFARLIEGGTWVKRCEYLHALTETAPAHAALYTAKTPRESGITANEVLRAQAASPVASLLQDPDAHLVGASGPIPERPGISLKQLTATTLSEALLDRDPRAVVVSISTKDRGAAFAGARVKAGQRPPDVVWWDDRTAGVVTSTAFATRLPAWVVQPKLPERFRWEAGPEVGKLARLPDDQPGEAEDLGGRVFPHVFAANGKTFRLTAGADALTVDLALAAARAARSPEHPMLLALSFSRYDYVGHRFGPDSWEAWEALLELDRELARLLNGLDAVWGKDAYSIVLTADHGVAPLPESVTGDAAWCRGGDDAYERPCAPGVRLRAKDLGSTDALVYADRGPELEARLRAKPGIARVFDVCKLDPSRSQLERLVYASVPPCEGARNDQRVPSYFVVASPGSFFDDPPDVAGHGTPYRYDRTVPLLIHPARGTTAPPAKDTTFRAFYASVWLALTGE